MNSINKYIPEKGTTKDLFKRLSEYISIFDKNWIDRIKPTDLKLVDKLERLSNKKIPEVYKEFLKYMGDNDDNLIEELFGSVDNNMTASFKRLIESYELMLLNHPRVFENGDCLEIYVDEFECSNLSLDLSNNNNNNPSIYMTSGIKELIIEDREEEFYSESLEHLLFQAVFYRYEIYRYEKCAHKVLISFFKSFTNNEFKNLSNRYNKSSLIDIVNLFGESHNFKKLWFSDKKHYIGYGDNANIYISTSDNMINGHISISNNSDDYIDKIKTSLKDFFHIDYEDIEVNEKDENEIVYIDNIEGELEEILKDKLEYNYCENLKISGVINKKDIEFINTLNIKKLDIKNAILDDSVVLKDLELYNSLEEIAIPTLETITERTFLFYKKLKKVINLDKVKVIEDKSFSNCISLESISLDNVESIGYKAFEYCRNLTEVGNMKNVREIYMCAFMGCESLERIELPTKGNVSIFKMAFMHCRGLKEIINLENVKKLSNYPMAFCSSLEKVDLPEKGEIDRCTFLYCTALKEIRNLDKLEFINRRVFEGCLSLEKIVLKEGVILEEGVFRRCESLKEIVNLNKVKKLGEGVFSYCYSLEEIELPENAEFEEETFLACKNLKEVKNLDKVKLIKARTFERCSSLEKVVLAEGVVIEADAFKSCINLKEVVNLDKAKYIDERAFEDCISLKM